MTTLAMYWAENTDQYQAICVATVNLPPPFQTALEWGCNVESIVIFQAVTPFNLP